MQAWKLEIWQRIYNKKKRELILLIQGLGVVHAGNREDGDDDVGEGQSWDFLTLDTLESTPNGVTSPTTVTLFVWKSMLNEVTPAEIQQLTTIIFFNFQDHKKLQLLNIAQYYINIIYYFNFSSQLMLHITFTHINKKDLNCQ